ITRRGSTGNPDVSGPHPLRRSVDHDMRGNAEEGSVTYYGADTSLARQWRTKPAEGRHAGWVGLLDNPLNINVVCAMWLSESLPCSCPLGMSTSPPRSHSTCLCDASDTTSCLHCGVWVLDCRSRQGYNVCVVMAPCDRCEWVEGNTARQSRPYGLLR